MSFMDEIRKIPPVTRTLCGSLLELVTKKFEIWRVFTSFFLGGSGINFIFDLIMLYRNSDQLESNNYVARSADYAWQLLIAGAAILAMNIPLQSFVHTRPLLIALTYVSSRLAPPGTQTSIFGLISMPLIYFPCCRWTPMVVGCMGNARPGKSWTGSSMVAQLCWQF
ncbi:unnamed protein product [Somion occarium]|uniref:Derlin n=1 Tax=Somion occarium TaxID=3059160 RepID=A0ABP1DNW3_9APHY